MIGSIFLRGWLLGLGAAVPLGPINIEIIRRSLLIHPLAGAALGAGAVTADTIYIALTYGGTAALISDSPVARGVLGVAGAAFLLYLGVMAVRSGIDRAGTAARFEAAQRTASGHAPALLDGEESRAATSRRHIRPLRQYGIGLGLTMLNPYTIAYWLAVSSEVVALSDGGWSPLAALAAGVVLGAGGWVVFLTSALAAGRRLVGVRFLMAVSVLGGLVLVGFAGWRFGWLAGEMWGG
jgi:L-lysine exporter family protein LysE/ArgO